MWAGHVNIYGYVEPRSQHASLCSPLIMVHHQDNTIPHLQDYINWQVKIVQDSASVSLFMMMSWHRNAFHISQTLWRESTGDSTYHRSHVMDCNLKWALIEHILTLKRPGLCGWLRPTQFKPRLDWVGSVAQVRRYCVDSEAQAFIHALAGCSPRSLQYALCSPRNSRPAHFAAHALDVLATHESPSLTQLST